MGRREEMLSLRSKLLAERPDIKRAYQLAPLMGEFEREYWRWCLEGAFAEEDLIDSPSSSVDEGSQTDG